MKKEVKITVDGLVIAGQIFFPEEKEPPYPAVILCHGIPSGIVDPADGGYPLLATRFAKEGFEVLTFSFRGTGYSGGNFDIEGWTHDLKAATDYVWNLPETDVTHLVLVGFSAGATVSIYVAAHDKRVTGVAACACPADFKVISEADDPGKTLAYFRKIGIIRDSSFPYSLEAWLNGFRRIDALHSVAEISPRPLILVHATDDSVVPVVNARKLYEKAGDPKRLIVIDGEEHRLRRNAKAMEIVSHFLKENIQVQD
jgi:fermentation-respiration switch protein FrsA (DUF1100 family)